MCDTLRRGFILLVPVLLLFGGCASPLQTAVLPGDNVGTSASALETQALAMSMADDYIASLSEAVYLLTRRDETDPRSRWLAQSFLRNGVGSSLDIAASPNSPVAILDLLVLASLQTWSFEHHWIPAGIGDAGVPVLARLRDAEARMWVMAHSALSDDQVQTVRRLVDAWIEEHPDRTVVALVRFEEFAKEREISSSSLRGRAFGLLQEVSAASSAIDEARLLGECALWYSGRYLYLVGQQAELTMYRLADQPEGRQVLETLRAIDAASTSIASRLETFKGDLRAERAALFEQVAVERVKAIEQAEVALAAALENSLEDLASRIAVERQAAVEQVFGSFNAEWALLLDDLEARSDHVGGVMAELRDTIQVSGGLASELTGTVEAIDRVVSRFDTEPGDGGERLSMTDVRDAAEEAKLAALELTRLLEATDQFITSEVLDRRLASVVEPANSVVDRAFRLGVILIGLLIVGFGLMLLVVGFGLRRVIASAAMRAAAA